jgi:hypothetical protein
MTMKSGWGRSCWSRWRSEEHTTRAHTHEKDTRSLEPPHDAAFLTVATCEVADYLTHGSNLPLLEAITMQMTIAAITIAPTTKAASLKADNFHQCFACFVAWWINWDGLLPGHHGGQKSSWWWVLIVVGDGNVWGYWGSAGGRVLTWCSSLATCWRSLTISHQPLRI